MSIKDRRVWFSTHYIPLSIMIICAVLYGCFGIDYRITMLALAWMLSMDGLRYFYNKCEELKNKYEKEIN